MNTIIIILSFIAYMIIGVILTRKWAKIFESDKTKYDGWTVEGMRIPLTILWIFFFPILFVAFLDIKFKIFSKLNKNLNKTYKKIYGIK